MASVVLGISGQMYSAGHNNLTKLLVPKPVIFMANGHQNCDQGG